MPVSPVGNDAIITKDDLNRQHESISPGPDEAIPIIFLSAKIQTEDIVKGFAPGSNNYNSKPFNMEELILRIQHLLKNNQQAPKK